MVRPVALPVLLAASMSTGCGLWTSQDDAADPSETATEATAGRPQTGRRPPSRQRPRPPGEGLVHASPTPTGPLTARAALPPEAPELVLLVVLDTVRSDRTSLCGHTRPTTPTLVRLAADATAWTCDAYAPSPWTLPSHATFFTGQMPTEHGVLAPGVALPDAATTAAEAFAARGYQTLLVSANPTLGVSAPGLDQGFHHTTIATRLVNPLRGQFSDAMGSALDRLDASQAAFVVVNLFDAHDPYPPVPPRLGWAPGQPATRLDPWDTSEHNPYVQFLRGTMPEARRARWLTRIRNAYDHGIRMADRHVAMLLTLLDEKGWKGARRRMILVSDHGEYLGEHGLLRHGSGTFEPVVRIPLLVLDDTVPNPQPLPTPVSAAIVHDLLIHGRPPNPLPVVSAVSTAIPGDEVKPSWDTVSVWADAHDKVMWKEGKHYQFDLAVDPDERLATPPPDDHPALDLLAPRLDALRRTKAAIRRRRTDPTVAEALRVLGYTAPDEPPP